MSRPYPGRTRGAFTLSTREQIIAGRLGGEKAWNTLTPEQQEAYIKEQQQIEKRNRDWAIQAGLPNNSEKGTQGLVSQGTMADFPEPIKTGDVAQKLKEEKIKRNARTFTRAVKMKLREQGMDPNNETLIQQGLEQLQTSCRLTGKNDEENIQQCIEKLTFLQSGAMPSQNGARRRNRTKHRRSRHKRTRRYRKN